MKKPQSFRPRSCVRLGMIGFLVPAVLMAFIFALSSHPIQDLGSGPLEILQWTVLILALFEFPPVQIARALAWPVENQSGVAFIIYNLNALGYAVVVAFWTILGALIGLAVDMARSAAPPASEPPQPSI